MKSKMEQVDRAPPTWGDASLDEWINPPEDVSRLSVYGPVESIRAMSKRLSYFIAINPLLRSRVASPEQ